MRGPLRRRTRLFVLTSTPEIGEQIRSRNRFRHGWPRHSIGPKNCPGSFRFHRPAKEYMAGFLKEARRNQSELAHAPALLEGFEDIEKIDHALHAVYNIVAG